MGSRPAFLMTPVFFFLVSMSGSFTIAQERFEPSREPSQSPHERIDVRQAQSRSRGIVVQNSESAHLVDSAADALNGSSASLLTSPAGLGASLKMLAVMTVLGLVPSIVMMTTCFVRFSVVLNLLRQAIGTHYAPPNQILTALSLFLTFLVMSPVWQRCYDEGICPYIQPVSGQVPLDDAAAFTLTVAPLRQFMSQQIDRAGNSDSIWMLLDFQRPDEKSPGASRWREPQSYEDISLMILAPAYLLSELKVAFLIGFQIFLPFLVIDLVVASILTSLGLIMLPPSLISLPFKLLLFVLIDGWFLTVGMLLESVRIS
ncbi:MAG: flagellar type III secretion system pore protein FliP [Planctomycetales bacterium]|nr:flagellar type III secretion system pore protein FliP [Planctomycetales bacterium]